MLFFATRWQYSLSESERGERANVRKEKWEITQQVSSAGFRDGEEKAGEEDSSKSVVKDANTENREFKCVW